jgi:hypothetical protein
MHGFATTAWIIEHFDMEVILEMNTIAWLTLLTEGKRQLA